MNTVQNQVPPQRMGASRRGKKPYTKPVLTVEGDVRTLTLAPSPGIFESGPGYNYHTPGEP